MAIRSPARGTKELTVETANDARRSTSYRDTFRRHRILLCLPIVLAVIVASFVVLSKPPRYSSTVSVWVDAPPPTASTVGANAPVLAQSPAAGEQSLLSELLATRAFVRSVAAKSLLRKHVGDPASHAGSVKLGKALSKVSSTVAGPQVLQISFEGPSPAVASSTLTAVVNELWRQSKTFISKHNDAVEAHYRNQEKTASTALTRARDRVTAYLRAHPQASASDPTLATLTAAQTTASDDVAQARTDLNQAAGGRAGGWSLEVIDSPSRPVQVSGGKKKLVMMIFAGIIGGGLVSLLGLVALTPGKREPWEDEMPAGPWDAEQLPGPGSWGDEVPTLAAGRRVVVPWAPSGGDPDKT
jgi:uncharacterized protein involved in exopolysaccharide biosynthesis